MTDIFEPSDRARGDTGLEQIERSGVEITPEFVTAFNSMSDQERTIWVEDAGRNILANEFGWAAIFLNDSEIGPLLRKALGPPAWSPLKLKREIEKTNWWKNRTDSQRMWDQESQFDPTTANRKIEAQARGVRQVVAQFGGALTDEQVTQLASESLRSGWNNNEILSAVAAEMVKGLGFGSDIRFGIVGRNVRQTADRFGVPLSQSEADQWSTKIATGQYVQEDFENWVRSQAKGLYPSLAADIDRGMDVDTLSGPYRQVAMNTLGLSPDQINFADPKWNAALNFDDGKGRRMMTLFEWGEHLRRDEQYGYDRTPDARGKAYQMVDAVGRMFGLTA
jgi:hypothetical protein